MAYEFVDPPRGLSYAAPAIDFGIIGDLPKTYRDAQKARREEDIATTFKGGLPIDPTTGQPDYAKAMAMLAAKGDIGAVSKLAGPQLDQSLIQRAGQISPLLGGASPAGGASAAPSNPAPMPAAPQSLPAPPVGPPARGGGDSAGSVVDIVAARLPQDSQATGAVIANIARAAGVDPNAPLTPEQSAKVTRMVEGYAARTGAARPPTAPAQPVAATPADTVGARFPAMGGAGGPSGLAQIVPGGGSPEAPRVAEGPAPSPNAAQVRGVQGQPQGPIFPQVPLPPGYKPGQEQEAIMAMRREAVQRAAKGARPEEVNQLAGWADKIEASLQPLKVGPNDTYLDRRTGQPIYQGASSLLDPETITFMAEQYRAGDTSVLQNLGRGAQGAQNIVRLREEGARQNKAMGVGGADQANRNAEFFGVNAGQRTLGTRSANIELAATEFKQVLPIVSKASLAVDRTNYPTLNSVFQAVAQGTGDTKIVAFASGVNTLINLYARAISPTGVPTVSDKDHAREILDKAWSQGQFDAATGMMAQEIDAALNSPEKVRDDMRKRFLGGQGGAQAAPREPASQSGDTAAGVGRWEGGPGGRLRPAQ